MIVKKFAGALRRQDWTAVAIEFLLVVLGILIAFQINEWAADKASEETRAQDGERLLDEVERAVAYLRQATDYERGNVDALLAVIKRVDAGGGPSAAQAALMPKLVSARSMVALAPPSSVYDDLVSSGELNRIGDNEVRAAIGRFRSTLTFEERMRQQLQATLPAFERIGAFRYTIGSNGRLAMLVDFAALERDLQARQLIALTTENHRILLMLRTRALRDSERMCLALGESVGRACNLHRPPQTFD